MLRCCPTTNSRLNSVDLDVVDGLPLESDCLLEQFHCFDLLYCLVEFTA